MLYKRLICFDFDDTLFHTPLPEEGKIVWKEKTGTEWPHRGWWGKPESIDDEIFDIPRNEWTYQRYLEAVADPDAYVILATGRLDKVPGMRSGVEKILRDNNIEFDEVHLNWGSDTFIFKCNLLERTIKKLGVKELKFYDDRAEHLPKFVEWAKEQDIKSEIIDVVNKTVTTIEGSSI
jgi:hypothetical protein